MSFGKYLKQYRRGELHSNTGSKKRKSNPQYPEAEKKLIDYINLHSKKYTQDKCDLMWTFMQAKALQYAKRLNVKNFTASSG